MKKKLLLCGITLCLILISVITITAYNKQEYKELSQTKEKIQSNNIAMYLINDDGTETEIEEFPDSNEYVLDTEKSKCENGSTITWEDGKIKIITTKSDKCNVYFKTKTLKDVILAQYGGASSITEVTDFSTATTESDAGMYKAEDDYGDSYYYRGNVTNNYVQFGQNESGTSMYWRIVRVNGDGTIRMIYAGTSKVANGESNDSIIEFPYYNENYDNKMYVGYMYGTESDPYGDITSTTLTDSDIKTSLDTWYTANIKTNYETYIADSIFCNDREEYSNDGNTVSYKAYNRLVSTYEPVLTCTNQRDRFTKDDTTLGNGHLNNPVGLLTADEVVMAGYSWSGSTTSNYLDVQDYFWTSSSNGFDGSYALVFAVGGSNLHDVFVHNYLGARPVVNLKVDVEFAGTGTIDDPYVITTN